MKLFPAIVGLLSLGSISHAAPVVFRNGEGGAWFRWTTFNSCPVVGGNSLDITKPPSQSGAPSVRGLRRHHACGYPGCTSLQNIVKYDHLASGSTRVLVAEDTWQCQACGLETVRHVPILDYAGFVGLPEQQWEFLGATRYSFHLGSVSCSYASESRFIGVRLDEGGQIRYGWILMAPYPDGAAVHVPAAWAFESEPDTPIALPACNADVNFDGLLDFFDYLTFAQDFENGSADFNGDSVLDFFDYLDFVAAFVECDA